MNNSLIYLAWLLKVIVLDRKDMLLLIEPQLFCLSHCKASQTLNGPCKNLTAIIKTVLHFRFRFQVMVTTFLSQMKGRPSASSTPSLASPSPSSSSLPWCRGSWSWWRNVRCPTSTADGPCRNRSSPWSTPPASPSWWPCCSSSSRRGSSSAWRKTGTFWSLCISVSSLWQPLASEIMSLERLTVKKPTHTRSYTGWLLQVSRWLNIRPLLSGGRLLSPKLKILSNYGQQAFAAVFIVAQV